MDSEQHEFERIYADDAAGVAEIVAFLHRNELNIDDFIEVFLAARNAEGAIIACGGVAPGVIQCVAIDEEYRGCGMALSLFFRTDSIGCRARLSPSFHLYQARKRGAFFRLRFLSDCYGARAGGVAGKQPRAPQAISAAALRPEKAGSAHRLNCARNANPFTLGHLYLIETALQQCDWLQFFVVVDCRQFSYADRLALARRHGASFPPTIHEGTPYIISRATFPCYFLSLTTLFSNAIWNWIVRFSAAISRRLWASPIALPAASLTA